MKPDSELHTEVRTELIKLRGGRAGDIDVQVLDGVVTLTGNLPSDVEQWNLRDTLTAMPGVVRLNDETMIVSEPLVRTGDGDIARPWFPAG